MNTEKKKANGKQINQRSTKPVRIDSDLHHQLKVMAAKQSTTIRALVEGGLAEVLAVDKYHE